MSLLRFVLVALACAASATAATINSTWTGNSSNEWGTPNNWNPIGVPNNDATNIYNASLPPGHHVQLNGNFGIQMLSVAAASSVTVQPTRILTLNADGTINGVLNVGATGSFSAARVRLGTDLGWGGNGAVELRGVPVFDSPAGARLTVGASLTIHALNTSGGFGDVPAGFCLTNNGTIDFEGVGNNHFNHADGTLINAGTWKVRGGAVVNISAVNNPIAFDNSGLVEVDNGRLDMEFTSFSNTNIVRVRNGGIFEFADPFNNTGGTIELESGGKLVSTNFFGGLLTGGAIIGVGGVIEPQGTLILQGGPGVDAMDITGTAIVANSGNLIVLQGEFDLAGGAQFTGSGIRINGNVDIDGVGTLPLQLHGLSGNDTLTAEPGITLTTGPNAGAGSLSVKTVHAAGPIDIDSTDLTLANGCTLNSTGPVHLFPNAQFNSTGATFSQNGSTVQLDAGARITGGISLQNTTFTGGALRPQMLTLAGTNQISSAIETSGITMIVASGAAVLNGTSTIAVNSISSGTTTVKAAAPGASLTTGSGINLTMTQGTLRNELDQWRFSGTANFSSSTFVVAADFENDGAINLASGAQAQLTRSIVAGSTGTFTAASGTTVAVNGASTLGGTFAGAGNFTFSSPTVVTVSGYSGTGAITLNNGAKVNFSNLVPSVTTLTVNSNNAHVAFEGGLTTFSNATISGSGGIFAVTGNTIASNLFRIQSNSTHRGAGTTTTQGPVEYRGKLDGRTLIAQGATTVFQLTLQNNAVFENQDTLTLFNFGTPDTVTGTGIFRNTGTILQSDLFGPSPNTISSTFEQTATGTTTIGSDTVLTLNGNSTIAGSVSIPANGKLVLSANATNTTHNISGAVSGVGSGRLTETVSGSGGGTFEIARNSVTGASPEVTLTGGIQLAGATSTTLVRNATLTANTATAPQFGNTLRVEGGQLKISGGAAPLPVPRVFVTAGGLLAGPDTGPRLPFQSTLLEAQGTDIDACTIQNIDLHVEQTCSTQGVVDLKNSTLRTGPDCTATLYDGTHLTSSTGDGECGNDGGTWIIPEFQQVEITLGVANHEGKITAHAMGELLVNGRVVSGTSVVTALAGGVVTYNGPLVDTSSTYTAHGGSGANAGGVVTINNAESVIGCTFLAGASVEPGLGGKITVTGIEELRNSTVIAETNAEVNLTLPTAPFDRERVLQNKISAKNGTVTLADYFFPASLSRFDGTGCFEIKKLLSSGGGSADVAPGQSAGRFHLTGDFPLGSGSEIIIELGGTTQTTQYDLLAVTGVLTATSTSLRPRFIDNFQNSITPANTLTVIETTQPIVGSFFNVFGGRVMAADGSGTFSVTMANGNTHVVLGDFIPGDVIDSDNDGMSDEFENEFFGSPTGGDPEADNDGDGMSNLAEYRAGTNPVDPTSRLQIAETRRQGNDFVVVFTAAPDKTYRVEAAPDLRGNYPHIIATVPATATGGRREVSDPGGAAQPARFYRVVVVP